MIKDTQCRKWALEYKIKNHFYNYGGVYGSLIFIFSVFLSMWIYSITDNFSSMFIFIITLTIIIVTLFTLDDDLTVENENRILTFEEYKDKKMLAK